MTVTQIIYVNIDPAIKLEDTNSDAGNKWSRVLDMLEATAGFQRLYWGRRLEEPEKVQIHVVRTTLEESRQFLNSFQFSNDFKTVINSIDSGPSSGIQMVRHVTLTHQALENPTGKKLLGYPIGTAVYKGCDAAWYEGAWPLWTHIVRYVSGCKGIVGGKVLDQVDGHDNSYLVYVGWETVKHHDDYHHTKHFRRHFIILNVGHKGYAEYGHVIFKGIREKSVGKL